MTQLLRFTILSSIIRYCILYILSYKIAVTESVYHVENNYSFKFIKGAYSSILHFEAIHFTALPRLIIYAFVNHIDVQTISGLILSDISESLPIFVFPADALMQCSLDEASYCALREKRQRNFGIFFIM